MMWSAADAGKSACEMWRVCVCLWQVDDVDEAVRKTAKLVERHEDAVDQRPPEDDDDN